MTPPTDRIPATLVPVNLEGVRVRTPFLDGMTAPTLALHPDPHIGAFICGPLNGLQHDRMIERVDDLWIDLTHRSARYALACALNDFRWLPLNEGGQARPEWSPGLLACSGWRVARELGPVVGLSGDWFYDERDRKWWRAPLVKHAHNIFVDDDGWTILGYSRTGTPYVIASGPETGDLGRSLADRAALAAGFALADGDGLVLPWPEGVAGE